ncbi:MAG: hypothetical protein WD852_09400 [Methyloceanibacter sp.]
MVRLHNPQRELPRTSYVGSTADLRRKIVSYVQFIPGMILFGMTQITGKGIDKNTLDGVRMIRRAANTGSTRAMLILANFYNSGAYGVGLNPVEAKSLIAKAASLGDPAAKDMLASLEDGGQDKKAP